MEGIRIVLGQPFAELFSKIFPAMQVRTWLSLDDAFEPPRQLIEQSEYDDETDSFASGPMLEFQRMVRPVVGRSLFGGRIGYGSISEASIFPTYADCVSDDWAYLFGVDHEVENPEQWFKDYYSATPRHAYLSAKCSVVILVVDAAFVELFSTPEVLSVARRQMEACGVAHEPRRLSECDYL